MTPSSPLDPKSNPRQASRKKKNPLPPGVEDFAAIVSEFESDFLEFTAATDPQFDLDLLRSDSSLPPFTVPGPAAEEDTDPGVYARSKLDLRNPILQRGPRVVEGSIFGEKVILGKDVRVKGNVYGYQSVEVGENCVIEGNLVSDGLVKIGQGGRVEGLLTGAALELEGPLMVSGPVYSRGDLQCKGKFTARSANAGGSIIFNGDAASEVSLEAALILAHGGEIQSTQPLRLSGDLADLEEQKFHILWGENGQFRLNKIPFNLNLAGQTEGTFITVLTDSELEKLVAELAVLD